MGKEEIIQKLTKIVSSCLGEENINLEKDDILIGDDYGIDSMTMIEIVVEAERTFAFEVEDEYLTLDLLETIETFASYIYENIN